MESLKSADLTGLPFDTQRNDTWSLADMFEIYTGKKSKTANGLDAAEQRELIAALKAEDRKRHIMDAKALAEANDVEAEAR